MWFLMWLMGGQIIELLVVYYFPELLARLAVLPAGPARSIEIPPNAANAMSTVATFATDYRTPAAARSLDVARLPGPSRVDTTDTTLLFSRRPARILARMPWDLRRRVRPLLRVDMTNDEDRIVLRPRFYPTTVLPIVAAMIAACIEVGDSGPLLLAVFALPVIAILGAREARRHVDAIAAEVSARLRHLDYLTSDARIATEPPPRASDAPSKALRIAVDGAGAHGEEEDGEDERHRSAS